MASGPRRQWDRAFYARRCDAAFCVTSIQSQGGCSFIMPPAAKDDVVDALFDRAVRRIERPFLGPGEAR